MHTITWQSVKCRRDQWYAFNGQAPIKKFRLWWSYRRQATTSVPCDVRSTFLFFSFLSTLFSLRLSGRYVVTGFFPSPPGYCLHFFTGGECSTPETRQRYVFAYSIYSTVYDAWITTHPYLERGSNLICRNVAGRFETKVTMLKRAFCGGYSGAVLYQHLLFYPDSSVLLNHGFQLIHSWTLQSCGLSKMLDLLSNEAHLSQGLQNNVCFWF